MEKPKVVSEATLRRLPSYLHLLKHMRDEGGESVSCTRISRELRLDPTQVRKDLAVTGIVGKPRVGYDISQLIHSIETFLGWNNQQDAFLVGAGHLGTALLGYNRFKHYGLNIVAAFDTDRDKIGSKIAGRPVFSIAKLPDLGRRMHVHIGILTTPADAAQTVAELMVDGGIRAIWNFTPVSLHLPESMIVQKAHLYTSLAVLSRRLSEALDRDEDNTPLA
jgi:redox-sensing transcriptional repressor